MSGVREAEVIGEVPVARLFVESLPNGGGCEFGLRWTIDDLPGRRPLHVNLCAHGATADEAAQDFAQLMPAAIKCISAIRKGAPDPRREEADYREAIRRTVLRCAEDLDEAAKWGWGEITTEECEAFTKAATRLREAVDSIAAGAPPRKGA